VAREHRICYDVIAAFPCNGGTGTRVDIIRNPRGNASKTRAVTAAERFAEHNNVETWLRLRLERTRHGR